MATEAAIADPILALITDPPETFLALPPEEQAWRGRTWLLTWATGYAPDMAWWFALRDATEPDIIAMRETLKRVTDEVLPQMVAARVAFEIEIARQAKLGGQ